MGFQAAGKSFWHVVLSVLAALVASGIGLPHAPALAHRLHTWPETNAYQARAGLAARPDRMGCFEMRPEKTGPTPAAFSWAATKAALPNGQAPLPEA